MKNLQNNTCNEEETMELRFFAFFLALPTKIFTSTYILNSQVLFGIFVCWIPFPFDKKSIYWITYVLIRASWYDKLFC